MVPNEQNGVVEGDPKTQGLGWGDCAERQNA